MNVAARACTRGTFNAPIFGDKANLTELDVRASCAKFKHPFEFCAFSNDLGVIDLPADEKEEDIVVFSCTKHHSVVAYVSATYSSRHIYCCLQ